MAKPHVVILGAGFGGITCAQQLRNTPVRVTLVDRENYHLFTPLLYQVASSLLNPSDIAQPVRTIIRGGRNIRFRQGTVTGVDFAARTVRIEGGAELHYDYLVIATGSETNFFGMAEVEQHALGLKDLPEALELRNHILRALEAATRTTDEEERHHLLTFAVVGGGPTGVEYAGALSELARLIVPREYPELRSEHIRILLVEGLDRVLVNFDPKLSRSAEDTLRDRGVELHTGLMVKGYDGRRLLLSNGQTIETATVVWAAGVRPSSLSQRLDVPRTGSRRIETGPDLRVKGMTRVFAIGDVAAHRQDGAEIPMLAQPAMQEGRHVARSIEQMESRQRTRRFHYRDRGTMATIGRNAGVAEIGRFRFGGFIGWVLWLVVHLYFIIGLRNRLAVLIGWAWNYLRYDRPVRIVMRAADRHQDRLLTRDRES